MEQKQAEIKGGATLWARQTIESEIFLDKPDKWFKIWFYLVNRVSHKNTKRYKRGETFFQQEWVCEATGSTKDQLKKALAFFRERAMISTRRSTRGTWLKILNYSHYQRLDNYYYSVKAPDQAREKHERSTREAPRYNKNDKNDKNDKKKILSGKPDKKLTENYINSNKRKDIRIIFLYAKAKGKEKWSSVEESSFISRNVRSAKLLEAYSYERIMEVLKWLRENADFKWTLETVGKYIDEDLENLTKLNGRATCSIK